jgi:hypothetical protein
MASIEEKAEDFAERFQKSLHPPTTANAILREIDELKYDKTGLPVSPATKKAIAEGIAAVLNRKGKKGIIKEADNKEFLALVDLIVATLEKK